MKRIKIEVINGIYNPGEDALEEVITSQMMVKIHVAKPICNHIS